MADTFDVTQQSNPGGNVNQPASGTYGEQAALDRLKQAFPVPPGAEQGAPAAAPMPQPPSGGGISTAPAGLPPGLLLPTRSPDTPVSTPLATPPPHPFEGAVTGRQQRLATVAALLADPRTSLEMREWAQSLQDALLEGSKA